MLIDQNGEVGVHAFISTNQLIGESESWHQASLLEPENRAKAAREEDAFDAGESN